MSKFKEIKKKAIWEDLKFLILKRRDFLVYFEDFLTFQLESKFKEIIKTQKGNSNFSIFESHQFRFQRFGSENYFVD